MVSLAQSVRETLPAIRCCIAVMSETERQASECHLTALDQRGGD